MPSVALHLSLAKELLDGWRGPGRSAPFDPGDATELRAFRHGALGPDLGYFPGGQRILSDLAHRFRPMDLTRDLVSSARSPIERAFSWGWVTHVLADRAIHPWIGLGVGEASFGDRTRFVSGARDPVAHVRIETGVDLAFRPALGARAGLPLHPVFDRGSIGFLVDAYRRVYGLDLESEAFLESHRAVARMGGGALRMTGWLCHLHTRPRAGWVRRGILRVLHLAHSEIAVRRGAATLPMAYLNPILPEPWLLEAIAGEVRRFPQLFEEHRASKLTTLANCDLDSGSEEVAPWADHSEPRRPPGASEAWERITA